MIRRVLNFLHANPFNNNPVNYSQRDPAQIETDVDYAIKLTESYLAQIEWVGAKLEGANLLELGPGVNFGPQLLLASRGANVTLADRFLSPWVNNYHPAFYAALRKKWGDRGPAQALDRVIQEGRYLESDLRLIEKSAENLYEIRDREIDIVISNAVLEHVHDMEAVFFELARITRVGGFNLHQIDFRDHRSFDRPLELLLHSEKEFKRLAVKHFWEFGNRWRPSQVIDLCERNGFKILRTVVSQQSEPAYLDEFLPRLRASESSYRNWPAEDLVTVGARLDLVKTARSANARALPYILRRHLPPKALRFARKIMGIA